MNQSKAQNSRVGGSSALDWIADPADHRKWIRKFVEILKYYTDGDATISAILKDERLSQVCATRIRAYVDKDVTRRLNAERRSRGAKTQKQLKTAIEGFKAAIDILIDRGDLESTKILVKLQNDFSQALNRSKQAFALKRHGRDRAHSILSECQAFLEARLSQRVTYATLANLVNAGFQADRGIEAELITEEQIRKNLSTFRRNNPNWRNQLEPGFLAIDRKQKSPR